MKLLITTAALLVLGGCASDPDAAAADTKAQAAVKCQAEVPTGTRLPKCTTTQNLHSIGSQEVQDNARRGGMVGRQPGSN